MLHPPLPRLFCLVDATDDLSLLPALAAAGVDGFQVRAKRLDDRGLLGLTLRVRDAVEGHGAVVVVDDRLDVALAAGAAGVHLGARDLPVADARRVAPHLLVGATCRSGVDVAAARAAGADYAGFGPVFATTSKADLPAPLGVAALEAAVGSLPLVAIGGLDRAGAAACRAAGAAGVAVISAIWRHPDPVTAARELCTAVA
ncbi:MAG: thiamine phosphate synthase [Nocardioides sp.]